MAEETMNPYQPPAHESLPSSKPPALYPRLIRGYLLAITVQTLFGLSVGVIWVQVPNFQRGLWISILALAVITTSLRIAFLIAIARRTGLFAYKVSAAGAIISTLALFRESLPAFSSTFYLLWVACELPVSYAFFVTPAIGTKVQLLRRLGIVATTDVLLTAFLGDRMIYQTLPSGTRPLILAIAIIPWLVAVFYAIKLQFSIFWGRF